eukprot:2696428-Prorocentrum_lima.AAC.1
MLGIATLPCTVPRFTLRGGWPATPGAATVTPALPPRFLLQGGHRQQQHHASDAWHRNSTLYCPP